MGWTKLFPAALPVLPRAATEPNILRGRDPGSILRLWRLTNIYIPPVRHDGHNLAFLSSELERPVH